jgi:uncharacterized protein (DUF1330 family)
MKTNYKVAIALVAGAAIGGAAIQGLHAQAAFVVAEVDVSNQDGFAKEYVPVAVKALTESGSKPVARGGKTASIEGAPPKRIVINSFDTLDQAVAAYILPPTKKRGRLATNTERSASLPSKDCRNNAHIVATGSRAAPVGGPFISNQASNVCSWHLADNPTAPAFVRCWSNSGRCWILAPDGFVR